MVMEKAQHGMVFGTLATVSGLGDFVLSVAVGSLWTHWAPPLLLVMARLYPLWAGRWSGTAPSSEVARGTLSGCFSCPR
jgi:hypothetical protein